MTKMMMEMVKMMINYRIDKGYLAIGFFSLHVTGRVDSPR